MHFQNEMTNLFSSKRKRSEVKVLSKLEYKTNAKPLYTAGYNTINNPSK